MVTLLEKAFAEVAKLPKEQQEQFAKWILDELEDELRWEQSFERSSSQLSSLAQKALKDHRSGRTQNLKPDELE